MKKELGLDNLGVQKSLRKLDYLGDGLGQVPLNVMSGLVGQLTYFYTEKVGLAAGMVATMLLLAKFADALSDLVMGKIMDSSNSPKGKCRPWFLRMIIPTFLIIIILFTVPATANSNIQMAYVLITNILVTAVIYTAIAIPYGALMAMRTSSVEERGKMGIVRASFGYLCGMIIAILLIPVTNILGGDQMAWIKVAVIFASVSALALFGLYKNAKEVNSNGESTGDSETEKEEDVEFFKALKYLLSNKYWVIMFLVNLFVNISYGLSMTGGAYYAKYVLGNDNIVAVLGGIGLIPTFLGFIMVGPMAKKFGMAKTCEISVLIGLIATFLRVFMPASFLATAILGSFATFATIPIMCLGGALVNNCVEYNEWKFGHRMVGMSNSASSFGAKIGSGVGGSLVGWILAIFGYNAAASVQPDTLNIGIYTFAIYVPLFLFIIMFILLKQYDLEKFYPQIVKEIKERKNN